MWKKKQNRGNCFVDSFFSIHEIIVFGTKLRNKKEKQTIILRQLLVCYKGNCKNVRAHAIVYLSLTDYVKKKNCILTSKMTRNYENGLINIFVRRDET